VAHRGFESSFLDSFHTVVDEATACAAAMKERRRIIVEDVTKSPIFEGTPTLQMLLKAKVRAVQSTPLLSRDGKVLGVISTHFSRPHRPGERELRFLDILAQQAADLFERRRAEQALREAKEDLAAANRDLDQKIQHRTASLNEALKSLETLLYTIAHDLRAPNRAMQGYAHLLRQSYSERLDDQGRFYLQRISDAALKNDALIRDLLEFGRLVHAELPCHPLNPAPNVRALLQGFDAEIAEKKATVEVAGEWPKVVANDAALSHALTNLVSNALKYARPGIAPQIQIFSETLNGASSPKNGSSFVRLCVRDNGIGVPSEQREKIFQPFQRASNANHEGTGMGLAIVRKAAERMGGRAGVDSTIGEGSTFWFELKKA
jgi:signal transduction histidine kinase